MHQINAIENPAAQNSVEGLVDLPSDSSKDKWYVDDMETISEPPDAGEFDERNSDSTDYEEAFIKKKKKKTKVSGMFNTIFDDVIISC